MGLGGRMVNQKAGEGQGPAKGGGLRLFLDPRWRATVGVGNGILS